MSSQNYKSHLTQFLLNCFDPKDIRVANQQYTIDAQMLNLAACARESTDMRISREINAGNPFRVALNIDNCGVYYKVDLPTSLVLSPTTTELSSVVGTINGSAITITPLDDTLPVPTGVNVDVTRSSIPLSKPYRK